MIRGRVDTGSTTKALEGMAKQLAFAASRTANGLALKAQARVREEMGERFTLRRPDFIKGSVRVELGTKNDPQASVSIPPRPRSGIHETMALQEHGGIERAEDSGRLAQPIAARPTPSAVTTPSKWPSKLRRSFAVTTDEGDTFILQRTGRKGRKRKKVKIGTSAPADPKRDPNLRIMYKLRDEVPVKPRLGFEETCREVARTEAGSLFAKELANALRTAK
jgi:hypothetical protein